MNPEVLWNLKSEELKALYDKELARLHSKLLSGVAWEETGQQRARLAEISNVIYKKQNPRQFNHPAANKQRDES